MSRPGETFAASLLDDRRLANRLRAYGIKSRSVRIGDAHLKGYTSADFADVWKRYLPSASDERDKRDIFDNKNNFVPDVPPVPDVSGKGRGGDGDPFASLKDESLALQPPKEMPDLPDFMDRRLAR
jgi:Protein of unknown function (DUF3631)